MTTDATRAGSLRPRMMAASVIGLLAALGGALLTAGFMYDIAPLDLWTYPVASVLAIIAIVAAWIARSGGVKLIKVGESFPGWMSLLAFLLAVLTLFLTLFPSIAYIATLLS